MKFRLLLSILFVAALSPTFSHADTRVVTQTAYNGSDTARWGQTFTLSGTTTIQSVALAHTDGVACAALRIGHFIPNTIGGQVNKVAVNATFSAGTPITGGTLHTGTVTLGAGQWVLAIDPLGCFDNIRDVSTPLIPWSDAMGAVTFINNANSEEISVGQSGSITQLNFNICTDLTCTLDGSYFFDGSNEATSTHIQTVTPAGNSTIATSTSGTFQVTGFVADEDYSSGTQVVMRYAPNSSAQSSVANASLLFTTITFPITAAGHFSFSTTSPVTKAGVYTMDSYIETPTLTTRFLTFLGFDIGTWSRNAATTTRFTAATSTSYDRFVADTVEKIQTAFDNTVASTTCSFSGFDTWGCLNVLLYPQTQPITAALKDFRDGFLSYFPWGYVTRFIAIATGTAAGTLPTADVNIPIGPSDHFILHLDMGEMVAGAGTFLDSVKDRNTGLTFREEVRPYWQWFLALIVMTIIFFDILALRRHR